jgi:hypothetical protein
MTTQETAAIPPGKYTVYSTSQEYFLLISSQCPSKGILYMVLARVLATCGGTSGTNRAKRELVERRDLPPLRVRDQN